MTDDLRPFPRELVVNLARYGLPDAARGWATVSKAGWPDGPWHDEPDRVQWTDPNSELPCLITRCPVRGHLCGYVAVPAGHPLHGIDRKHVRAFAPGSVTFTGPQPGTAGPATIPPCDLNDPWWIGFDASHPWDICPGDTAFWTMCGVPAKLVPRQFVPDAEYRDITHMALGCTLLAAQLAGQVHVNDVFRGVRALTGLLRHADGDTPRL